MNNIGINLYTPICSTGYGVVGYNIWKHLRQVSDLTLFSIGNVSPPVDVTNQDIINIKHDLNKHYNEENICIKIWHENHLAERIGSGLYIAYPFFEVNVFDERRKSHLCSTDKLFVSSKWAKDIVLSQIWKNYDSDIHIVPCGVDQNIFSYIDSESNYDKCIFLNCGKWEIRKGHDILHRAFKDAFPNKTEKVELWMMPHNPFLPESEINQWKNSYYRADSRIKILDWVPSQDQLAKVMKKAFCGVFPARSEGWNLELLEMMSCGKHVIATNYSAHTEFCTKDNCELIHIDKEEPMYDGKWFKPTDGTWASLEGGAYDQLVEHLRFIYKKWSVLPESVNTAGIDTAKRFSWENSITQMMENIK